MVDPAQGEVWWAEAEDKRRPVLIVTRDEAIPILSWIVVAPVTRTIRGIPTEVPLDSDSGLPVASVATFDNLQPIRKTFLTHKVGSVRNPRSEVCRCLRALADC